MAREDAIEERASEGQGERVAPHDVRVGQTLVGERHHARALVEGHDLAPQIAGQVAGAAGHVQDASLGQVLHDLDEGRELAFPAGPGPRGEEAFPLVPIVVLGRPPIVVLAHLSRC